MHLPSPFIEDEMPEICLPLRKRPRRTTPGPGYEVGESSAAGAARQFGPTTAEADLYGFADMLDAAPGRQTSRELGYGITDTWDDLVGAIQEIAPTTLEGVNQRVTEDWPFQDALRYYDRGGGQIYLVRLGLTVEWMPGDQAADRRWQAVINRSAKKQTIGWQTALSRDPKVSEELKAFRWLELASQQGTAKDPEMPELPRRRPDQ
ncbi:hypothetical protein Tco_1005914 [Tanacetum coccineum]|uniref:Uncharacterized protein n=1 Tax=Tanacetum coccineum TaxID=301880 RepID=A0ABQ5FGF5_9ASTR